ncbi:methyltransferase-like protein 13 [Diaphorina citri]|uniref:Methyltransferase-like protein 13 n=1 Tax=Diaphorina citri TaxID=121845 RepID=A0A3Q0JAJ8_DIACI|nr:methyltransferase-like protein 13 [Diaphorina citri]
MFNLLPKTKSEFTETEYWDKFFKKRGDKAFEWYGEYVELCSTINKYMKVSDNILNIGCGNSKLSADLYDGGYKNLKNIDMSEVVIKNMNKKYATAKRPGLSFEQMDALNTTYENEQFNVILDKGTLDALMPDNKQDTVERIEKLFKEVDRILKQGGRYIVISLLQDHIVQFLVSYFHSLGWMLRISRCREAEHAAGRSLIQPVFVVIVTKFKKIPNITPVLEVNFNGDKLHRLPSPADVISAVRTEQQVALLCCGLSSSNISSTGPLTLDVYSPQNPDVPRYTLVVIDKPSTKSTDDMSYAAFIIPQGRWKTNLKKVIFYVHYFLFSLVSFSTILNLLFITSKDYKVFYLQYFIAIYCFTIYIDYNVYLLIYDKRKHLLADIAHNFITSNRNVSRACLRSEVWFSLVSSVLLLSSYVMFMVQPFLIQTVSKEEEMVYNRTNPTRRYSVEFLAPFDYSVTPYYELGFLLVFVLFVIWHKCIQCTFVKNHIELFILVGCVQCIHLFKTQTRSLGSGIFLVHVLNDNFTHPEWGQENPIPQMVSLLVDKVDVANPVELPEGQVLVILSVCQAEHNAGQFANVSVVGTLGYKGVPLVLIERVVNVLVPCVNDLRAGIEEEIQLENRHSKVPFLSLGGDIGKRHEVVRGESEWSGGYVVEDIDGSEGTLRRLIFMKTPYVIQSEIRLKEVTNKDGQTEKVNDLTYLSCEYHIFLNLAVALLPPEANILIVGLGGGVLVNYIHHCFEKVKITSVEIDPAVCEVATKYFGLVDSPRIDIHVKDGIQFILDEVKRNAKYDMILFDVDNKDTSLGLSCPPKRFLEDDILDAALQLLSGKQSVFLVNLVCRATDLRKDITSKLRRLFQSYAAIKMQHDVNEVIFCSQEPGAFDLKRFEQLAIQVNDLSRQKQLAPDDEDMIDVKDMVERFEIDP